MSDTLTARSTTEFEYYLLVTPCQACRTGPCDMAAADGPRSAGQVRAAHLRCRSCNALSDLPFVTEYEPAEPTSPCINPLDEPSRLVDLDQWLALGYMLMDRASRETGAQAHQCQIQAALCLNEALKFYVEHDEVPPAEAFFTDVTSRAFHEHPEAFAQQRLRDLLDKLPPPPAWPDEIT